MAVRRAPTARTHTSFDMGDLPVGLSAPGVGARPAMCPGPGGPAARLLEGAVVHTRMVLLLLSVRLGRLSRLLLSATMPADADTRLTAGGEGPMEVRLLGLLGLAGEGLPVAVGGVRQRAVLALLVLHANQVVPAERLLVELWGEDAPPTRVNGLQAGRPPRRPGRSGR